MSIINHPFLPPFTEPSHWRSPALDFSTPFPSSTRRFTNSKSPSRERRRSIAFQRKGWDAARCSHDIYVCVEHSPPPALSPSLSLSLSSSDSWRVQLNVLRKKKFYCSINTGGIVICVMSFGNVVLSHLCIWSCMPVTDQCWSMRCKMQPDWLTIRVLYVHVTFSVSMQYNAIMLICLIDPGNHRIKSLPSVTQGWNPTHIGWVLRDGLLLSLPLVTSNYPIIPQFRYQWSKSCWFHICSYYVCLLAINHPWITIFQG